MEKLEMVLFHNLTKEFLIYDNNENLIIMGKSSILFEMLGYSFLNLKVINVSGNYITVDIDLGGNEWCITI